MKKILFLMLLFPLGIMAQPSDAEISRKVNALLKKMTLEEKVGQMAQITLDVVCKGKDRYSSYEPVELDMDILRDALVKYHVGSILNTANNRARKPEFWAKTIGQIQDVAMKETRMGIPVIYGIDAIHGVTYTDGATIFPHELGLAATWNLEHARKLGEVTAYETRASSIPWNFSPVLDLGADPRYSRMGEGMGEDPYLISQFGREIIKGYEGDNNDISNPFKVASCAKHFLGYAVPISGKDRTPAYIPDNVLREYHLPPFAEAIKAGTHTFMINSGHINGVPVHASYELMTKLLREELGFQGLIVTDWGDIENLYKRDRVAADNKEALKLAINAGIDMSMISYNYEGFCNDLVAVVKEGGVSMKRIDDAVRRILTLKYKLNIFEKPVSDPKDYPDFGSEKFEKYAYDAASEAITLLKNDKNILPLPRDAKVLVTGPTSNSMRPLNGCWTYSWQGELSDEFADSYNTVFEAIQKKIGKQAKWIPGISFGKVMDYRVENFDKYEEAIAAARDVDYIILCLGENSYAEKPGDLVDLTLSRKQLNFAKEMLATGKPVILVLAEGRPRVIREIASSVRGILMAYWPGNFGGDALADIIFGDVNPSGKLPITYPSAVNSLVTYIHKHSEEQVKSAGMYNYEGDFSPEFEFGYGLSYTTFSYGNLQLSTKELKGSNHLTITVDVSNTGQKAGKEVVQLYTSDLIASITPDVKRLRRFEKILLQPGETKKVTFTINATDLAFVNAQNKWITEPGEFEVMIGNQKAKFNYKR
ncbi:MAG: glycoside hydrolase family 3 C-terminal domain-containing protein [Bacteroidales bacterium]|jgi:beta-glucosidase|nr:glycoside hydrolase family 3 C-terminal domain-containing protein [Bacteroidales bacterium]